MKISRLIQLGTASILAGALVVTAGPASPVHAAPKLAEGVSELRNTPVRDAVASKQTGPDVPAFKPAKTTWPTAAAEATIEVAQRGKGKKAGPVSAAPGKGKKAGAIRVGIEDQKVSEATIGSGVVFTVAGEPGDSALVDVSYADFADAIGAGWASRLELVQLPDCALTTPSQSECQTQTPIPSTNDTQAQSLSGEITLSGARMVLAATAATSGDDSGGGSGDFGATSLSPSSSWEAGGSSGAFTWSYPMRVVPVPGGLEPSVAINYSSAEADGRTAGTNNQPSWLGEGFDLSTGFIERRYQSCAEESGTPGANNATKTGDLCWYTDPQVTNEAPWDNAVLSLAGHSGVLVRQSANLWRLQGDDGTRVEKLGTVDSGESWRVTTSDGTQYYFGKGAADGGGAATNARWSVPVAGNHAGEPGYSATFANSFKSAPWRWNLDYVVSVTGQTITYRYAVETNRYKKNLTTHTDYDRGGYLASIEYGQQQGQEGQAAPAKVVFRVAERCFNDATLADCGNATPTAANASHWPDVPVDAICASGTCSTAKTSPTFFTRKKLIGVDTFAGGSAVDSWDFEHSFPATGDRTESALWLAGITHTGKAGAPIAMPKIVLKPTMLRNRATGNQYGVPLTRARLGEAVNEMGGRTIVGYTPVACDSANLPVPATNTSRCFPAFYRDQNTAEPKMEWFNKYVVDSVLLQDVAQQVDPVAGAPASGTVAQRTSYEYEGAAWHWDDTPMVKDKERTWSQWRGYRTTRTIVGDSTTPKQVTETTTFQGMDGDKLATGTKVVKLTDATGAEHVDHAALMGTQLQTRVLTGVGGSADTITVTAPWLSDPTANDGRRQARLAGISKTTQIQALAAGGTRRTELAILERDSDGLPTKTENRGDLAVTGDETCRVNTYTGNRTSWLIGLTTSETINPGLCGSAATDQTLIQGTRTYYDGATSLTATPSKGQVTRVDGLAGDATTRAWRTEARTTYDTFGRPTSVKDTLDRETQTTYTHTAGLLTQTEARTPDPDGAGPQQPLSSITVVDARWGAATKRTTSAGQVTEGDLDALGRTLSVWQPGRSRSQSPSTKITYSLNGGGNGVSWVKTESLNADGNTYRYAYVLADSLGRERQTQTQSQDGLKGRVINDKLYDARGLAVHELTYVNTTNDPQPQLVVPASLNDVPKRMTSEFDFAGRPTKATLVQYGVDQWATTTSYGGDRQTVTPPAGGTPLTTVTDAQGNVTARIQHLGQTASTTTYAYDLLGNLVKMTDPTNKNHWTWTYNLDSKVTATQDPDKGAATATFDEAGRQTSATDARGKGTRTAYDALDRIVETTDLDGVKLTSATYDPTTGLSKTSTRWANGQPITTTVDTYDNAARPTKTTVTVPAIAGLIDTQLAGSYSTLTSYLPDGSLGSVTLPAAANLPAETLATTYNNRNLPSTLTGSWTGSTTKYASSTTYTPFGELAWITMGSGTGAIQQRYYYQAASRRLNLTQIAKASGTVESTAMDYDPSGNITKVAATQLDGAPDTQCYAYDAQKQLTEAWTPLSNDCGAPRSQTALGGVQPYWTSWQHDTIGRTLQRTDRTHTSTATTQFTYNADGTPQPHFITQAATTGSTTGTMQYTTDPAGNTTSRPGQTLSWNTEGKLATVQGANNPLQTNLYDPAGNRILRREAGRTTLYVAGAEITLAGTQLTAQRYYQWAGKTIALRSGASADTVTNLVPDHQNTTHYQVNAATGATQITWNAPYGVLRNQPSGWQGEASYVGGRKDAAIGLTHIGAREYDQSLGRFISVDPLLDLADSVSHNAYIYANNTPITASDPTGLRMCVDVCGGEADRQARTSFVFPPPAPPQPAPAKPPAYSNYTSGKTGTIGSSTGYNGISKAEPVQMKPDYRPARGIIAEMVHVALPTVAVMAAVALCVGTVIGCIATVAVIAGVSSGAGYALAQTINDQPVDPASLVQEMAAGGATGGLGSKVGAAGRIGQLTKTVTTNPANTQAAELATSLGDDVARCAGGRCGIPGKTCFVAGTLIRTEHGDKPIEAVTIGDMVWSRNFETGREELRPVVGTYIRHADDLFRLNIEGTILITTADHPFMVKDQGWTRAGALNVGDVLVTQSGSTVLANIESALESETVFNFQVATNHNYYVVAGAIPVLVHNADYDDLVSRPGQIADRFGATVREVKDAIHLAKSNLPRGGPIRNPDVSVHPVSGEIYPQLPDGSVGDSIGNMWDLLGKGGR